MVYKVLGYARTAVRLSPVMRGGLTEQRTAIRRFADASGWTLVEVGPGICRDAGVSGLTPFSQRVGGRVIQDIILHNNIHALLVCGLERISRSVVGFAEVEQWMCKHEVKIIDVTQPEPDDRTAPRSHLTDGLRYANCTAQTAEKAVSPPANKSFFADPLVADLHETVAREEFADPIVHRGGLEAMYADVPDSPGHTQCPEPDEHPHDVEPEQECPLGRSGEVCRAVDWVCGSKPCLRAIQEARPAVEKARAVEPEQECPLGRSCEACGGLGWSIQHYTPEVAEGILECGFMRLRACGVCNRFKTALHAAEYLRLLATAIDTIILKKD